MTDTKTQRNSLILSVILTLTTLLTFQVLLFQALTASFQAVSPLQIPFLLTALGYHIFLAVMLLSNLRRFRYTQRETPLYHINATNKLTMIRLSSMPSAGFLIYLSGDYPEILPYLTGLMILVFLTDAADGFIARKTNQITEMGKMMDSSSDYLLLYVIAVVFLIRGIISPLFFGLLTLRLLIQAAGMIVFWLYTGDPKPESTLWGKIMVFCLMALFAVELAAMLPLAFSIPTALTTFLEYGTMGIILISLAEKIRVQYRNYLIAKEKGRKQNGGQPKKDQG